MIELVNLLLICGVPVFVIASIATPAGVGGGMLYVPLMILTGVADPRLAAVLASPIIVGAALAGNIFNIGWQLRHPQKILLDGQLAMAMVSPALAGNLVGTILNQALPKMVILLLLLLIIVHSLVGSFGRARRMWKMENSARAEQSQLAAPASETASNSSASNSSPSLPAAEVVGHPALSGADIELAGMGQDAGAGAAQTPDETADDGPYHQVSFHSEKESDAEQESNVPRRRPSRVPTSSISTPSTQAATEMSASATPSSTESSARPCREWLAFVFVWLCMIAVVALRGGGGHSIVHIQSCSWQYWTVTGVGFVVLVLVGFFSRRPEVSTLLCITVGAVSAMVGIGGAVILNPMMVKRGVEVQTATATAGLLVLAMSTSTSALFILGGSVPLMPALVLGVAAFLGSMSGKTVVGWLVKRTGRTSLIVILLACFIALSGVAVGVQGIRETVLQLQAGENPLSGFKEPCASS